MTFSVFFILAAFYAARIRSGSVFSVTMRIRIRPNDADPTGFSSGSTTLLLMSGEVFKRIFDVFNNVIDFCMSVINVLLKLIFFLVVICS